MALDLRPGNMVARGCGMHPRLRAQAFNPGRDRLSMEIESRKGGHDILMD